MACVPERLSRAIGNLLHGESFEQRQRHDSATFPSQLLKQLSHEAPRLRRQQAKRGRDPFLGGVRKIAEIESAQHEVPAAAQTPPVCRSQDPHLRTTSSGVETY